MFGWRTSCSWSIFYSYHHPLLDSGPVSSPGFLGSFPALFVLLSYMNRCSLSESFVNLMEHSACAKFSIFSFSKNISLLVAKHYWCPDKQTCCISHHPVCELLVPFLDEAVISPAAHSSISFPCWVPPITLLTPRPQWRPHSKSSLSSLCPIELRQSWSLTSSSVIDTQVVQCTLCNGEWGGDALLWWCRDDFQRERLESCSLIHCPISCQTQHAAQSWASAWLGRCHIDTRSDPQAVCLDQKGYCSLIESIYGFTAIQEPYTHLPNEVWDGS